MLVAAAIARPDHAGRPRIPLGGARQLSAESEARPKAVIVKPRSLPERPVVTVVQALTESVLRPIRQVLPPMGGLDLSPIVLLIGLQGSENGCLNRGFMAYVDSFLLDE